MAIGINIDLTQRRRQQEALAELERQRQAVEGLAGGLFGTPAEGPPTVSGVLPRYAGGAIQPSPQAELIEAQMMSGIPGLQQSGLTQAQQLLESQRQQQLAEAQQAQLQQALQMPAFQATPELRGLSALVGAGAAPQQVSPFAEQFKPFTLSPEQARFTGTGQPIAKGLPKAEDLEKERNRLFNQSTTLRKEFVGVTKPFVAQNEAYGRVIASAQNPSPAGDLALIFNFMKVLDPGSTVREGEFAQVGAAGGLPTQAQRLYESWVTGKKLTDEQRADVVSRARKLFQQASKQHKVTVGEFKGLAERQGLRPEDVIIQRQTMDAGVQPPSGFILEK